MIGSPIAGREHPDLEGQIGFYLGALPIRTQFGKEDTVTKLYQRIKENTLGAYSHQVYPYDELVDALNLTRDTSRNPLFNVWLDYHNIEIDSVEINLGGIRLKGYPQQEINKQTKFDLTVVVQELGLDKLGIDKLGIYWEYNRDIYSASQMHQMEMHFSRVLQLLVDSKEIALNELSVLEPQDEQKQLALNPAEKSYDSSTVLAQFGALVKNQGNSVALKEGNNKITYQELDQQSNRLANYLLTDYRINKVDRVGIKL